VVFAEPVVSDGETGLSILALSSVFFVFKEVRHVHGMIEFDFFVPAEGFTFDDIVGSFASLSNDADGSSVASLVESRPHWFAPYFVHV